MVKLLRAYLSRMWRSKCLWICAALAFAASVVQRALSGTSDPCDGIFDCFPIIAFIITVFVPLFLGTEYSDKTIRNKLSVGSTRAQIYLASLFASITGVLLITAAGAAASLSRYIMASLKYTTKNIGYEPISTERFVWGIIVCVCAVIAECALLTLLGMLITKRSSGIVWAVFAAILIWFSSPFIGAKLKEPETFGSSRYDEQLGVIVEYNIKKNDKYISGFPRAALGSVYSVIPFGAFDQANNGYCLLLSSDDDIIEQGNDGLRIIPLYSLGAAAAATAAGIAVFRRKEIR